MESTKRLGQNGFEKSEFDLAVHAVNFKLNQNEKDKKSKMN